MGFLPGDGGTVVPHAPLDRPFPPVQPNRRNIARVNESKFDHPGFDSVVNKPRKTFDLSNVEPFVDATIAGEFIGIHRATVLRLARKGKLPGHPVSKGKKRWRWRFLLSELRVWLEQQDCAA